MKAPEVIACLKNWFDAPAHAFLEQVADATGARQRRWADAIAMSVWPSRGYDIHGIEVKVSRYDWQKELDQPQKSAAVQQYCNRWWIATPDETIIHAGELPPTWGWMVTTAKGGMRVVVDAPTLTPAPVSVEFVASVLRNVQKADDTLIEKRIQKAREEAREDGSSYYQKKYADLKKIVDEFEACSGIDLNHCWDGGKIGEHVWTLRNLKDKLDQINRGIQACDDVRGMLSAVEKLADLNKPEVTA